LTTMNRFYVFWLIINGAIEKVSQSKMPQK
jgi:hypothetical protein